jgi:hypothetical protein
MTEKKNKEVSRDSTRYPAGQANAENSQGAEIVRLLLPDDYKRMYQLHIRL